MRRCNSAFSSVEDAVVVRVRVERVDQPVHVGVGVEHRLGAIEHTVVVAVSVQRVGARGHLLRVGQPVAVRVVVGRIVRVAFARIDRAVSVHVLGTVADAAAVGVGVQRVGRRRRIRVGDEVARARVGRHRRHHDSKLGAVEHAVVVRVRVERVDQPVHVRVGREHRLCAVDDPVVVGVRVAWIRPDHHLETVGQAVTITVVVQRIVRVTLAWIDATVRVRVFETIGVAAVVGVGVERVGRRRRVRVRNKVARFGRRVRVRHRHAELGPVAHTVVVRVRVEGVDQPVEVVVRPVHRLRAVEHTVVIAVGVHRVGAAHDLFAVGQAVAVTIVVVRVVRVALADVDAAVAVRILGTVGHATRVRVAIQRVGRCRRVGVWHEVANTDVGARRGRCNPAFSPIEDAVVVRVWIERVDQPIHVGVDVPHRLRAIEHTVVVRVGVQRVRPGEHLVGVADPVAVGVVITRVVRVGLTGVDATVAVRVFDAVRHAAGVGVRSKCGSARRRIGVRDEVAHADVGICKRGCHPDFGAVEDAVVVRVGIERVDQPVHVGVAVEELLRTVADTVVIGVRVERVGADRHLANVRDAVAVGVGVQQVVRADVRVGLTEVDAAVAVHVFGSVGHGAVVGVRVERVGRRRRIRVGDEEARAHIGVRIADGEPHLGAVGQQVVVRVRVERVDQPVHVEVGVPHRLGAVGDTVVVSVTVVRVGAGGDLGEAAQTVGVRVDAVVHRVEPAGQATVVAEVHVDVGADERIHRIAIVRGRHAVTVGVIGGRNRHDRRVVRCAGGRVVRDEGVTAVGAENTLVRDQRPRGKREVHDHVELNRRRSAGGDRSERRGDRAARRGDRTLARHLTACNQSCVRWERVRNNRIVGGPGARAVVDGEQEANRVVRLDRRAVEVRPGLAVDEHRRLDRQIDGDHRVGRFVDHRVAVVVEHVGRRREGHTADRDGVVIVQGRRRADHRRRGATIDGRRDHQRRDLSHRQAAADGQSQGVGRRQPGWQRDGHRRGANRTVAEVGQRRREVHGVAAGDGQRVGGERDARGRQHDRHGARIAVGERTGADVQRGGDHRAVRRVAQRSRDDVQDERVVGRHVVRGGRDRAQVERERLTRCATKGGVARIGGHRTVEARRHERHRVESQTARRRQRHAGRWARAFGQRHRDGVRAGLAKREVIADRLRSGRGCKRDCNRNIAVDGDTAKDGGAVVVLRPAGITHVACSFGGHGRKRALSGRDVPGQARPGNATREGDRLTEGHTRVDRRLESERTGQRPGDRTEGERRGAGRDRRHTCWARPSRVGPGHSAEVPEGSEAHHRVERIGGARPRMHQIDGHGDRVARVARSRSECNRSCQRRFEHRHHRAVRGRPADRNTVHQRHTRGGRRLVRNDRNEVERDRFVAAGVGVGVRDVAEVQRHVVASAGDHSRGCRARANGAAQRRRDCEAVERNEHQSGRQDIGEDDGRVRALRHRDGHPIGDRIANARGRRTTRDRLRNFNCINIDGRHRAHSVVVGADPGARALRRVDVVDRDRRGRVTRLARPGGQSVEGQRRPRRRGPVDVRLERKLGYRADGVQPVLDGNRIAGDLRRIRWRRPPDKREVAQVREPHGECQRVLQVVRIIGEQAVGDVDPDEHRLPGRAAGRGDRLHDDDVRLFELHRRRACSRAHAAVVRGEHRVHGGVTIVRVRVVEHDDLVDQRDDLGGRVVRVAVGDGAEGPRDQLAGVRDRDGVARRGDRVGESFRGREHRELRRERVDDRDRAVRAFGHRDVDVVDVGVLDPVNVLRVEPLVEREVRCRDRRSVVLPAGQIRAAHRRRVGQQRRGTGEHLRRGHRRVEHRRESNRDDVRAVGRVEGADRVRQRQAAREQIAGERQRRAHPVGDRHRAGGQVGADDITNADVEGGHVAPVLDDDRKRDGVGRVDRRDVADNRGCIELVREERRSDGGWDQCAVRCRNRAACDPKVRRLRDCRYCPHHRR